jgi:MFS transporter, CP family, cyanate transporter
VVPARAAGRRGGAGAKLHGVRQEEARAVAAAPRHRAVATAGFVLLALNLRMAITSVPPILPDLGLSSAGESLLTTLPVLLFGGAAAAGPALRARLGEERGLFAALALTVAGILARGLWLDAALFPATIVACAGIAVLNVLLPSFVRGRFAERVGPMTAAYTTALTAGATLAAGLTVPIRSAAGGSNAVALGIWAAPAAVALLAWVPQLRSPERHIPGPRGERRAVSLWRSPLAWQVTLFMGLQSLAYYAPLSWLPTIYREQGLSAATAGALLSVFNAVGIAANLATPVIAHRMRDQRAAITGAVALTAVGVVGLLVAPADLALLWAVVLGLGQGAALSLALLLIVMRAPDHDTSARLSSMAQGIGYLLAAAGPLGMGLLHGLTGGWTVPLLGLLVLCAFELAAGLGAGRARVVAGAPA